MDSAKTPASPLSSLPASIPAHLETATPHDVVEWAAQTFGDELVVTASFADPVLVHVVSQAAPNTSIVLLDTQYHFAETWWYARKLEEQFNLQLSVVSPVPSVVPDDLWRSNIEGCCFVRKVEPLQRALSGKSGWVTGLRRSEAPTRLAAPVVSFDLLRNLVKINPLAAFSDEDMAAYIAAHNLPEHPLTAKGYPSIGCWPCTNPVAAGADPRSGRWQGADKTECGLHPDSKNAEDAVLGLAGAK
jgi:phosphoadenosine phosphosulfate reductase